MHMYVLHVVFLLLCCIWIKAFWHGFAAVYLYLICCLDWIFAAEWRWQHKLKNSQSRQQWHWWASIGILSKSQCVYLPY